MLFVDWFKLGGSLVAMILGVLGLFDGFRTLTIGTKSTADGVMHVVAGILFLWLMEALIAPLISRWWRGRQAFRRVRDY